jgi:glycerophosphoryl diester phosphodiesterase
MAAFRAAHADGAVWIETDVKLTLDGVPVLFHDDLLDRTTNGKGAVAAISWSDLQDLDAGSWFGKEFAGARVPALAELLVFAVQADMRLNLELKPCPGRARATAMVALIEAAKTWPQSLPAPLISSFDIEALVVAAQIHPDWPRGLLLDEWRDDWREQAELTQASTLHVNEELLTPERLVQLRLSGFPLLSFTVNDPARARHLLSNGVRGIFTDDPGAMLQALG